MLIILLVYTARGLKTRGPGKKDTAIPDEATPHKTCILCGSGLLKGQRLKSKELKGKKDSIVTIYGCPHCYGAAETARRTCPVCRKVMPPDGYLTGRMWKTKKGNMHLHVSGCTLCRR